MHPPRCPRTGLLVFAGLLALAAFGAEPAPLAIFSPEQPVSFFFRDTEASAALRRLTYEEWSARYGRLSGVMGKMLDEEVLGRSAAQAYYRRFKAEHPEQAVMLHANGTFRSPRADNRAYHAGHWLYYNGARVLDAVPAGAGTITLRVADASLFNRSPYRVNPAVPEDVGLCAMTADGKPDWSHAEQAAIVAVDAKAGTLTIERGVYGSKPQAFAAGAAYVAAHVAQTWGTTNKLWQFNMATTCPRDVAGKTAADRWAAELVAAIQPGGAIAYIDGVEFDVPFRKPMLLGRGREADCDADGKPDNGIVGGAPVFALGVDNFFRALRAALPEKLIMADVGENQQRSVATLNGIETEGWPKLRDPEFLHWSIALNHHCYWGALARPPVFHYGLMKFLGEGDVPLSRVRLTLAGPLLVDAAVPMGYLPPAGSNGVWDELLGGTLQRRGWLGRPLGPARWLADESPDLFAERNFAAAASSTDASVRTLPRGLEVAARNAAASNFTVRVGGLRLAATTDLVVRIEASALISPHEHRDAYRVLSVAVVRAGKQPEWTRSAPAAPVAGQPFYGRYFFRDLDPGDHDLVVQAEGPEAATLHAVSAHAASDIAVRSYERGVILANPSHRSQTFDLKTLLPGAALRRIEATAAQDPRVNSGVAVGAEVTLPPKDALFLHAKWRP